MKTKAKPPLTKPRHPDDKTKIAGAALELAAQASWATLNFAIIAKTARLPLAAVERHFTTINDILIFIIADHDQHVLSLIAGAAAGNATPHDLLFEVLMARFDRLQANRQAFINLQTDSRRHPALATLIGRNLLNSMKTILRESAIETSEPRLSLAAAGLFAMYIRALCVWQADQSADLSKTMAALDGMLRRTDKVAQLLSRLFARV